MDQIPRPEVDARPPITRGRIPTDQRSRTATRQGRRRSLTRPVETVTTVLGGLLAILAFTTLVAFAWPVLSGYLTVAAVVAFVFAPVTVPVLSVRAVTTALDYLDGR